MLKGVNKRIIEVCETGNVYFERVLLFVRPEYSGTSESRLEKQANKYVELIKNSDFPSQPCDKAARLTKRQQKIIAAAVCGVALLVGLLLCGLR